MFKLATIGIIKKVVCREGKGGYNVVIEDLAKSGEVTDIIPLGPELIILEGEFMKVNQPLTNNPNVSGLVWRKWKSYTKTSLGCLFLKT